MIVFTWSAFYIQFPHPRAVYTFYNDKARRAELISLELFEGTQQTNATVFSSLSSRVTPLVERQAFILGPTYVTAMKDTVTDKGITRWEKFLSLTITMLLPKAWWIKNMDSNLQTICHWAAAILLSCVSQGPKNRLPTLSYEASMKVCIFLLMARVWYFFNCAGTDVL